MAPLVEDVFVVARSIARTRIFGCAIRTERHSASQRRCSPNFNAHIRLVWNFQQIDQNERVTISQWNKALRLMHQRFLEGPRISITTLKESSLRFFNPKVGFWA